jgi:CspA family cold shock protein
LDPSFLAGRAFHAALLAPARRSILALSAAPHQIAEKSMTLGVVKWFNTEKGYGFIATDDGPDIFVHYSGVLADGFRKLNDGDRVEFVAEQGRNGRLQAVQVKVH